MKSKMGYPTGRKGGGAKGNCLCFIWSEHDRNEYLLPSDDGKATVAHLGLQEVQPEHSYEKHRGPKTG